MPIKVTLEFDTVTDMLGFFGQAKTPAAATKPSPTPAPAAASSAPAAPAASPASSSAPAKSPAPAGEAPAITYPDVQKAVFALAAKSRDAAIALNQKFSVKSMKELDAARWPEALAAAKAALAELEGAS